uniref:Ependymin-1-like n=1 Tax=Hippocampus comes TaxID=109280 RepID=A0A3Q2YNG8_HIPCM
MNNHPRTHSHLGTILSVQSACHACFWNVRGTLEYPEKTHAGTGRTCKPHTGRPQLGSNPGPLHCSPNMTGSLSVMGGRAETKAVGLFTYDSMNKKLRFQSNSSLPLNVTLDLDLLVFFEEGILYKIDSKNQSCEKKALQSRKHPFALPSDATFMTTMTSGSAFIEGEGLKFQIWTTLSNHANLPMEKKQLAPCKLQTNESFFLPCHLRGSVESPQMFPKLCLM